MWKGRARIELNFRTKRLFDKNVRVALIAALVTTLISPWFAQEAEAVTPFYYANSNEVCAMSIFNTNQDPADYHTTVDSRYDGTYCYLRFTTEVKGTSLTNTMWLPSSVISFDYLIVAGGGGGGVGKGCANEAGGGGAGGLRFGSYTNTTSQKITLLIGGGGGSNTNGSDSYISDGNSNYISFTHGGGHGATCGSTSSDAQVGSGGSGGGGTHNQTNGGGGNTGGYSPSEGNNGGTPTNTSRGGGGGGWATAGGSAGTAGTGYVDTASVYWPDHTNIAFYKFAFGGNGVLPNSNLGDTSTVPGGVSTGIGGNTQIGGDAVQDTGSGGGGSFSSTGLAGGAGADGVIFIRYYPGSTDGLNMVCVADAGADTILSTSIYTAANSTTSDAVFPYPDDTNFVHGYGNGGPRNCGTAPPSGDDWTKWTEYLYGYIKAPASSSSSDKMYLVAQADDGVIVDVADDVNTIRNIINRPYDDGGNAKVYGVATDKTLPMADLSHYVSWTAGKWYPIRIWQHENGGGASLALRYIKYNGTNATNLTNSTFIDISRTNFSTRKPVEATLSYTGLTGVAGTTYSPTYTVTSVGGVDSDGTKSYSSATPSICTVDVSTGVAASVSTGTCTILLSIAATTTFAPRRISASFRIGVTPNMETDTALNLTTNAQIASNTNGKLIQNATSGSSSFTIEAWVNPSGLSGTIFQQGVSPDGSSAQSGLKIYLDSIISSNSLKVFYTGFGATALDCDRNVPYGQWSHIAIAITLDRTTTSNSTLNCYVDGFLVKQPTIISQQNATLSSGIYVGNNSGNSNPIGKIDEVKVFNTLRTQTQIQSDMQSWTSPTTSGLVAYYDFNEGASNTAFNVKAGAGLDNTDLSLVSVSSVNWVTIANTGVDGAYTYWSFTRTFITSRGAWKVPDGVKRIKVLVIGGGGGGGSALGGGGGAGGYLETVTTANAYETITVGVGGATYRATMAKHADNGGDTTFSAFTMKGGGAGGSNVTGLRNGNNGGSGGGGAMGSGTAGTAISSLYGNNGNPGTSASSGLGAYSGSGGGAASVPIPTSPPSKGGAGKYSSISSVIACYATGGGGSYISTYGNTTQGGGACDGGSNANNNAGTSYFSPSVWSVTANTGSGGAGGGDSASGDSIGQNGSAGIVVIHYITASKPIFTTPAAVDTTTAGKPYSFTIGGSPITPLARTYQWQWTNGTASTWVNYTTSDTKTLNFASPETMTSGATYSYRAVVTDGDSDGLSIVDTSTTFYLIINPRNTITSSTSSFAYSQKYGDSQTVTFTYAFGTGTRTSSVASTTANTNGYLTWSNLSGTGATLSVNPVAWAGSYTETLTVTDSVSAYTTQVMTITIGKADTITVITSFAVNSIAYSGSAIAAATRTITGLKGTDAVVANATSCQDGGACVVGDVAPGGGYVFYVSSSTIDVASGVGSAGGIYLATAPSSYWTTEIFCTAFGQSSYSSTYDLISYGASNTAALTGCTSGAINSVKTLSFVDNGITYNDWFLPSTKELVEASKFFRNYTNRMVSNDSTNYYYWSSRAPGASTSEYVNMLTGATNADWSTKTYVGMPIRAFSPTKSYTVYKAVDCANGGACAIGDTAPGGGKVFYVAGSETNTGTNISSGGIYLATAPVSVIQQAPFCSVSDLTTLYSGGAGKVAAGFGAENTENFTYWCDETSATDLSAQMYDVNGYEDWFLPSKGELALIYSNLIQTGGYLTLPGTLYWTSSLVNATTAYTQNMSNGVVGQATLMTSTVRFLPIRAFNPTFIQSYSPPTDADTYTVISSVVLASPASLSNYQGIQYTNSNVTITRVNQAQIQVPQYAGPPATSVYDTPFTKVYAYGGSGPGSVHLYMIDANTTDCLWNLDGFQMSRWGAGSCAMKAVKAGSRNYNSSTVLFSMYWYVFEAASTVSSPGGSHAIPIRDANTFTTRTDSATVSSFNDVNGNSITSARGGDTIRILIDGFSGLAASDITVYFNPYEDATVSDVQSTYVQVVVPATATTGRISVDGGARGMVLTPSLTITP